MNYNTSKNKLKNLKLGKHDIEILRLSFEEGEYRPEPKIRKEKRFIRSRKARKRKSLSHELKEAKWQ